MEMERTVLVNYFHEISLKGKNRPFFLRRARENLERALRGTGAHIVREWPMYALLEVPEPSWPQVRERLAHTLGVEKFALGVRVPADLDAIKGVLDRALQGHSFASFRVTAHRTDKRFPLNSMEIARVLGGYIKERSGARVDLQNPEWEVEVRILPGSAYVYLEEYPGPGGLPPGVGGRVVALLSGGIDSPVASYRMMRRGCEVVFVHFHSFPLLEGTSREKARDLAQRLTRYQFASRLYLVPLAEVQRHIIVSAPRDYRVVLYRRFMFRIAERLAHREGALALVTGESLGQVSSQTLENLRTIEEVVSLPVLRPLIGMDKQEIIAQAKALGTYEVSILPDQDCCSLLVPPHPVTRSRPEAAREAEAGLDVEGLVEAALREVEVVEFTWPPAPVPAPGG